MVISELSTQLDNPLEKDINQGTSVVSNLDYSVSNNDLHQIFGIYGEIQEIHETPQKFHLKFIDFYDVRATEPAHCALNKCNIAGKQINLGPSSPGGARQCLNQKCSELEQDEAGLSRSSGDISTSKSMSTISHGGRTVGCYDNGSVQGLHFASHVTLSGLTENALSHGSSCVPNSLLSPLRVASAVNHLGFHKSHHSMDQVKSKCIPSFHPHSFPDCQDNFNISVPHNSSSTVANMAGKFGSRVSDGMNGSHISMVGLNGQPMELKGGSKCRDYCLQFFSLHSLFFDCFMK
ncbi:Protein MEI2-like 4 [Camellia lanceoleosa]|uniref:Protein MEI2-like 4 n=1 Tax=Camellia lanceoleosa TaxID=1840588 RepID=A0ACC0FBT2_9ERIC|nr:Protein MEI2-like 4 [Camellia lanceoleosa]